MYIARVVRGQVLSLKEKEFVEAARAAGASSIADHRPAHPAELIGPIIVNATLAIAAAIITESTLSFLGFGVQPPNDVVGQHAHLRRRGQRRQPTQAYLLYFPGLMILITVLCVNFLGDGLRDAFDPQAARSTER